MFGFRFYQIFRPVLCGTRIEKLLISTRARSSGICLRNRRLSLWNLHRFCSHLAPNIHVPSGHLLVDDDLHITVSGLDKAQPVTLYALLDGEGKQFESYCWMTSDDDGKIDLRRSESQWGTYTGASSMGLFWSMVPCHGQMDGLRLMKTNMDTPFSTVISVYPGHLPREQLTGTNETVLCSAVIDRWYKSPGVRSIEVTDSRLRGTLFLPPGPGPHQGVIDLFGTVGGILEYRSALLASRGFASLALSYFNYKDLPKFVGDVDLDYFMEAIDWLLAQDGVISDGVGVMGTSKGGDIALKMGTYSSKVKSIVNVNGCTFCTFYPMKYSGGDFPAVELDPGKFEEIEGKYTTHKIHDFKPSDIFHVWNRDAKVLNILSEDDLCAPKESIRMLKSLYPKEKTDNCMIAAYDGAGHLIDPPYTPLCRSSYHKVYGMHLWLGGQPKEHAFAQEDSWRRILHFFRETLTPPEDSSILQ